MRLNFLDSVTSFWGFAFACSREVRHVRENVHQIESCIATSGYVADRTTTRLPHVRHAPGCQYGSFIPRNASEALFHEPTR